MRVFCDRQQAVMRELAGEGPERDRIIDALMHDFIVDEIHEEQSFIVRHALEAAYVEGRLSMAQPRPRWRDRLLSPLFTVLAARRFLRASR